LLLLELLLVVCAVAVVAAQAAGGCKSMAFVLRDDILLCLLIN